MPKNTCVPKRYHEIQFESIDNNKHRTRFEFFEEDEEIEDESVNTFDIVHENYYEFEMHDKRLN